ncbi:hypothetical protein B0I08_1139 [Glaciihabitans tibetensis]|uniref:Uncharacterized protein n=1 Tax=Glaciihabitans tibetensis TaxID=1266600 RepID=A0A2T0V2A3_9MICO|nr:hypothetical protein [Glaciihabitans tibetensis]PRY64302.1 hypothetical protein B0I08_1139 [Glaciihabitans tibetensis]
MLTDLGQWAAARDSQPAPALRVAVITECPERAWTVVSQPTPGRADRQVLGLIQRVDDDYEVTIFGDPIRMMRAADVAEAVALVSVDASSARSARAPARGVG